MTAVRQAIVIRRDLWMQTGLQIALANQASMRAAFADDEMRALSDWIDGGHQTDVYIASSEGQLDKIQRRARTEGAQSAMVSTTIDARVGQTHAVLAVGPAQPKVLARIVDGLQRY